MGFLKTVKKEFHFHCQGNCFLFIFAFNLKEFTPYDCVAGARYTYELISFISHLIYDYVVVLLLSCVLLFSTLSTQGSTPGSPVLHCLQDFAQIHVH